MYGIFFKKGGYIDCKIIAFRVKKRAFFLHLAKLGWANFEFLWLNFFSLLKVKVFDIIVVNQVENLKKKSQKWIIFISYKTFK
jgi:hypothetical protein